MFKIFILFLFINLSLQDDDKIENLIEVNTDLNNLFNKSAYPNEIIKDGKFIKEPDFNFDAEKMAKFRGYDFEKHYAVTEDCYILEIHRIINPLDKTENKVPILLQHGLIDSSLGFMMNTLGGRIDDNDDKSLAFALAKRGYDIWLGNFRGNIYSMNHTTLNKKDSLFWRFSYDNHALQDLPAQIAYIQNYTKYDQIGYVGFSQGTMTMFELLALRPEYSKVIKPFIALAPVAYVKNIGLPVKTLAKIQFLLKLLARANGPLFTKLFISKMFSQVNCDGLLKPVCNQVFNLVCGYSKQINSTRIPVYLNNLPAGTSITNIVHFAQGIRTGEFRMFDYMNSKKNEECYGVPVAPEIPLQNINSENIYLFNSENDILADIKDVEKLKEQLKVKFYSHTIKVKEFNHIDFLLSMNDDVYVYKYLFDIFKQNRPIKNVENEADRLILKDYDEYTCLSPSKKTNCNSNLIFLD